MDALFEGLSSERFISYLTEKLCLFCKDKPIRAVFQMIVWNTSIQKKSEYLSWQSL
jgi:hypothetical protein